MTANSTEAGVIATSLGVIPATPRRIRHVVPATRQASGPTALGKREWSVATGRHSLHFRTQIHADRSISAKPAIDRAFAIERGTQVNPALVMLFQLHLLHVSQGGQVAAEPAAYIVLHLHSTGGTG